MAAFSRKTLCIYAEKSKVQLELALALDVHSQGSPLAEIRLCFSDA
jgi:hypothetical protein